MLEGLVEVTPILRAGVYALVRGGVVVYVGQGQRMLPRIEAHRGNWGRRWVPAWMPASMRGVLFDQVFVLPCRVEDLDRIERGMIDLYKPRYNIALKAPGVTKTQMEIQLPSGARVPFNQPQPTPRF